MRVLYAIAKTTVRSSLRSRVFHVVLFFLILAICVLPITIKGDGSVPGLLQVSLTYTLNTVGVLLSVVVLWLGCTVITDDVEQYQAHLVFAKPVSRLTFWAGKLLGILALQLVLLLIAGGVVYAITMYRFNNSDFVDADGRKLNPEQLAFRREAVRDELLVGRQLVRPNAVEYVVERQGAGEGGVPETQMVRRELELSERGIGAEVDRELARRLATAGEIQEGMTEDIARSTIRRQMMGEVEEIKPGLNKTWTYRNLPAFSGHDFVHLRYRFYVGTAKTKDQVEQRGIWSLLVDGEWRPIVVNEFTPLISFQGGTTQTLSIPSEYIAGKQMVQLRFENLPGLVRPDDGLVIEQQAIVHPLVDGPMLMVPKTSFLENFARVLLLIFLQIVFLGILGCVCGALLSTPVAIFLAFSYVLIGTVAMAMMPATPEDNIVPKSPVMYSLYVFRVAAQKVMVSVNEFNQVGRLARGELVEWPFILLATFHILVLRGVPIAVLGTYFFRRRELGKVVRR